MTSRRTRHPPTPTGLHRRTKQSRNALQPFHRACPLDNETEPPRQSCPAHPPASSGVTTTAPKVRSRVGHSRTRRNSIPQPSPPNSTESRSRRQTHPSRFVLPTSARSTRSGSATQTHNAPRDRRRRRMRVRRQWRPPGPVRQRRPHLATAGARTRQPVAPKCQGDCGGVPGSCIPGVVGGCS